MRRCFKLNNCVTRKEENIIVFVIFLTKFKANISMEGREKSGILKRDGLTDKRRANQESLRQGRRRSIRLYLGRMS